MNSETALVPSPAPELLPALLFRPTPKAAKRVREFFTAQINNDHTRKAYLNATRRFAEWCDARGIGQLAGVEAIHVAAFVKELQGQFSPAAVKQHLTALRMLFDWLVTGHVLDVNPARAVRGPQYVVKKGKTPVLAADDLRPGQLPEFSEIEKSDRGIILPMKAHVWVMLKPTVLDPQGQTIQQALASLGYTQVREVRQGKFFILELDGVSRAEAEKEVERIARDVLANPVIEQFRLEIVE